MELCHAPSEYTLTKRSGKLHTTNPSQVFLGLFPTLRDWLDGVSGFGFSPAKTSVLDARGKSDCGEDGEVDVTICLLLFWGFDGLVEEFDSDLSFTE